MQTRIAKDVLRYLSERVLLAGEKTLDLLQGLLLMTAWYHGKLFRLTLEELNLSRSGFPETFRMLSCWSYTSHIQITILS